MADGRIYDDRNDYARSLKAHGLNIADGEQKTAPETPMKDVGKVLHREMQKRGW